MNKVLLLFSIVLTLSICAVEGTLVEFKVKIPSDSDIRKSNYMKSLSNITVELTKLPQYTQTPQPVLKNIGVIEARKRVAAVSFSTEQVQNLACYTFIAADGQTLFTEYVSFSNKVVQLNADHDFKFIWDSSQTQQTSSEGLPCTELSINENSNILASNQINQTKESNITSETLTVMITLPDLPLQSKPTKQSRNLLELQALAQQNLSQNFDTQIDMRKPRLNNLYQNQIINANDLNFSIEKDSNDQRVLVCNLKVVTFFKSTTCQFDLYLSTGVYQGLIFISTIDDLELTQPITILIVKFSQDLQVAAFGTTLRFNEFLPSDMRLDLYCFLSGQNKNAPIIDSECQFDANISDSQVSLRTNKLANLIFLPIVKMAPDQLQQQQEVIQTEFNNYEEYEVNTTEKTSEITKNQQSIKYDNNGLNMNIKISSNDKDDTQGLSSSQDEQPQIIDFQPRVVLPYLPFNLELTLQGSLDKVQIDDQIYPIIDGKVTINQGFSQNIRLQNKFTIYVMQVKARQFNLLQAGLIPIHNGTHLLKNLFCKTGFQVSLSKDGQCFVQSSTQLWISYDQTNWFKYADVILLESCKVSGIYEIGHTFNFPNVDYCKINQLTMPASKCVITQMGTQTVSIGINSWISADGQVFLRQESLCGSIEAFGVNITSFQPKFLIRFNTNQILHIYGNYLPQLQVSLQGQLAKFHKISDSHAYVPIPALFNKIDKLSIDFYYKSVQSQFSLNIPLVEQPQFNNSFPIQTTLNSIKIVGKNLFNELELQCYTNVSYTLVSVFKSQDGLQYVECPLPQGIQSGLFHIYSQKLALYLQKNIIWYKISPAQVIGVTEYLQVETNQTLIVQFDKSVAPSKIYREIVLLRLSGLSQTFECVVENLYKPNHLSCHNMYVIQAGNYGFSLMYLKETNEFGKVISGPQIQFVQKSRLQRAFPMIIKPYQEQDVTLSGMFWPQFIKNVVFNQQIRTSPTFNQQGQIVVSIPVLTPQKMLKIQLESIFGDYSDGIYLEYMPHLTGTQLITKYLYANQSGQSIEIISQNFMQNVSYSCDLVSQSFNASLNGQVDQNGKFQCHTDPIQSFLVVGVDVTIYLRYSYSTDNYFISVMSVLYTPTLFSSAPQYINLGYASKITCSGRWTLVQNAPIIRLNQDYLVNATYLSPTQLTFSIPDMTTVSSLITIELSQDSGQYFTQLSPVDFTTGSKITLYPEPVPIIKFYPKVISRINSFTVQFTGTDLDKLISCSGILTPIDDEHANCQVSASPFQTSLTIQASTSLQLLTVGQIQILDIDVIKLTLPRHYTSIIQTNFSLDLPWSNYYQGYLINPSEAQQFINGYFQNDLLPVINVQSNIFSVQSNTIVFENQTIQITGLGFKTLNLFCQVQGNTNQYEVLVVNDTSALCYAPVNSNQFGLIIGALNVVETLTTQVQLLKKPAISNYSIDKGEILVYGQNLDGFNNTQILCEISGLQINTVTTFARSTSSNQLRCDLPAQQDCYALSLQLSFYHGLVRSNRINFIAPNFLQLPSISEIKPLKLYKLDQQQLLQFKFSDYKSCNKPQNVTCVYSSAVIEGSLDWPIGSCALPNVPHNQDLKIKLDGLMLPQILNSVVIYDLNMQLLSVSPRTFVFGYSRELKLLLAKTQQVSCLFKSQDNQYSVDSISIRNQLVSCQAPNLIGNYTLQVLINGSQLALQSQEQIIQIQVIQAQLPVVLNTKQVPPMRPIQIQDNQGIYDGCLFYKWGSSLETSFPCVPPAYQTELQLHVKGTDIFVPVTQIEVIQPIFTHMIINSTDSANAFAYVFVDQPWPENVTVQCVQNFDQNKMFVSTLNLNKCSLTLLQGDLFLQVGPYKTNKLQVFTPKELDLKPEQINSQNLTLFNNQTAQIFTTQVSVVEGSQTIFLHGSNILPTTEISFWNYTKQLSNPCVIVSQVQISCLLAKLEPGNYTIKFSDLQLTVSLSIQPFTQYYIVAGNNKTCPIDSINSFIFNPQFEMLFLTNGEPLGQSFGNTSANIAHWKFYGQTRKQIIVVLNQSNSFNRFEQCKRSINFWIQNCNLTTHGLIKYFIESLNCNFTLAEQKKFQQNSVGPFSDMTFTVYPSVFTCENSAQTFKVNFLHNFHDFQPQTVNRVYKLNYVAAQEAIFQLPCLDNKNLTMIDIQIGNSYYTVVQIKKFVFQQISNNTLVLQNRQIEFKILLSYLDQQIIASNDNTYVCSDIVCPDSLSINGTIIAKLSNKKTKDLNTRLLTFEVKLGFQNHIDILNGKGDCIVGNTKVHSIFTYLNNHPSLICFVYNIGPGSFEVINNGIILGTVLISPKPQFISIHLEIYNQTQVRLDLVNLSQSADCLIRKSMQVIRHSTLSLQNGSYFCELGELHAGLYDLSVGQGQKQVSSNSIQLRVLDPVSVTSIDPPKIYQISDLSSNLVTFTGSFITLLEKNYYVQLSTKVSCLKSTINQDIKTIRLESQKLVLDLQQVVQTVRPDIYFVVFCQKGNEANHDQVLAQTLLQVLLPVIIQSYKPHQIYQQTFTSIKVSVQQENQIANSCYSGQDADSLQLSTFQNGFCVLNQNDTVLALGIDNQIASALITIPRNSISIYQAHYNQSSNIVILLGSGLNQLTAYGKGFACQFLNQNNHAYQNVHGFSISNTLLSCKYVGKTSPFQVQIVSFFQDYFVETSRIPIIVKNQTVIHTNTQKSNVSLLAPQFFEDFTHQFSRIQVRQIYPRGFVNYENQINITIEFINFDNQLDNFPPCEYSKKRKSSQIFLSQRKLTSGQCVLDLVGLSEYLLIKNGLDLQIGPYFNTTIRFMPKPKIQGIVPIINFETDIQQQQINLIGENFWQGSVCVLNNQMLSTTYIDQNTLLCDGFDSVRGIWQVTQNQMYQASDPLFVEPQVFTVQDSQPKFGLLSANNSQVTISYHSNVTLDILKQNWSFTCVFEGINTTNLVLISKNTATCFVPSSLYAGTVNLVIKVAGVATNSEIIEVQSLVFTKFTYVVSLEDLYLSRKIVTLTNQEPLLLLGRNFNRNFPYKLCASGNQTSTLNTQLVSCFTTSYISDSQLQVDYQDSSQQEYQYFTLVIDMAGSYLNWRFTSALVVLNDPEILSLKVFKLNQVNQIMIEFSVQDMLVISFPTFCFQNSQQTQAWVSQASQRNQKIRCTNLTFGDVSLQVGDLILKSNVQDSPLSSVSLVKPTQVLTGLTNYLFQVIGVFYDEAICVFSQNTVTLYASQIQNGQCDYYTDEFQNQTIRLQIFEKSWNTVIYTQMITFQTNFGPHLNQVTPKNFYQTPDNQVWISLFGTGFSQDCQCIFGGKINTTVTSQIINSQNMLCVVPDLTWIGQQVNGGIFTNVAVTCQSLPNQISEQLSIYSKSLFKLQTEKIVVQELNPIIKLQGTNLTSTLICQLTVNGVVTETPFLTFNGSESAQCDASLRSDIFTSESQLASIRLKDINQFNSSIITLSNAVQVVFLPRTTIWYNGVPYIDDPQEPLLIYSSAAIRNGTCQFKSGVDNSFYYFSNYQPIDDYSGQCFLPQLLASASNISLSIRQQKFDVMTYTNWISLTLIFEPYIISVYPLYTPANESQTIQVYGQNLRSDSQVVFDDFMKINLTVVSPIQASFTMPKRDSGVYKIKLYNSINIIVIQRPTISSVFPNPVLSQLSQNITITGQGFSTHTQCQYFANQSIQIFTTFISPQLLRCQVNPQDLAYTKSVYDQQSLQIQVIERSMYKSNQYKIEIDQTPFVTKLDPNFLGEDTRELRVYVSSQTNTKYRFCKANSTAYFPVNRTQFVSNDCSLTQVEESPYKNTSYPNSLCNIKTTIYICVVQLSPGLYEIEMMNDVGTFTNTVSGNNTLTVIARPQLISVQVPALPLDSSTIVQINGVNFNSAYNYTCLYSRKFCKLTQNVTAQFVSAQKLNCSLPLPWLQMTKQFVVLKIAMNNSDSQYLIWESLNLIVFPPPFITSIKPNNGILSGGTLVVIQGSGLDQTLGGITAKFGQLLTPCTTIVQGSIIQCISPQSSQTGVFNVSVSINNQQNYKSSLSSTFTYTPNQLSVNNIMPVSQNVLGQQTILITGSNFPINATSIAYCQFNYSDGTVVTTAGILKSSTSVLCSPLAHYIVDSQTKVSLSFNSQQYQQVTQQLSFVEDTRTKFQMPYLISNSSTVYSQVMQSFQADPNICPLVQIKVGGRFQANIVANFYQDIYILITLPSSSLPKLQSLTPTQFATVIKETKQVNLTQQTYEVNNVNFLYLNLDPLLSRIEVYQQIYGLYSWLQAQVPTLPDCSFTCSIMVSIRLYQDPTLVNVPPQLQNTNLTCQVGAQLLQEFVSRNTSLTVECIMPYYKNVSQPTQLLPNANLLSIQPNFAFVDEANIKVQAQVVPIFNLSSLACKFQDVILQGTYEMTQNGAVISCVLPSFIYLRVKSSGLPPDNLLSFEVSLDGKQYTQSGTKFQLLNVNQFIDYQPRIGPQSGGTVITIQLYNFPTVNQKNPNATCVFPGLENDLSKSKVTAVFVNSQTIQCITPSLNISQTAVNSGTIINNKTYAIAKVQLIMLNYRDVYDLDFIYMINSTIVSYSPENVYFFPNNLTRRVFVYGQYFMPLTENIVCRVNFANSPSVFVGYFINNYTIACDIPPPVPSPSGNIPISVPLQVSFNNGQQYVANQVNFYYSPRDTITSIYPFRQYTQGNQLVKVYTSYFFDKSSNVAMCKFEYTDKKGQSHQCFSNIVKFDSEGVFCYIVQASCLSNELQTHGGQVNLSVSSNQQDYSNPAIFTYLQSITLSSVFPLLVPLNSNVKVTLNGNNFYWTNDTGLTAVRLTRILVNETYQARQTLVKAYYDGTQIYFTFPNGIFQDKDWLTVELTFDQITYTMSDQGRILVYTPITLSKIRPLYSYIGRQDYDIFLEAGLTTDPLQGGDIINTESFGYLQCRFRDSKNLASQMFSSAYFINITITGCPLPLYTEKAVLFVDLSVDNGLTFTTNYQVLQIIEQPVIQQLNNTQYYYTLNESVFIKLTGINLYTAGQIWIRVNDTTQRVQMTPEQMQSLSQLQEYVQDVVFKMPQQLDPGNYIIRISTDGLWFVPKEEQWVIKVVKCPNGYICSQSQAKLCPLGFYCPFSPDITIKPSNIRLISSDADQIEQIAQSVSQQTLEPIQCPPGTFQDEMGQTHCKQCPYNFFCPEVGQVYPSACPGGWLCQETGLSNYAQLKQCPEGYYCPSNTSQLNKTALFQPNNMLPCPNGFYCPRGTQDFQSIYGNFSTPQICKDGYICSQNVQYSKSSNESGATTQFGINKCLVGSFCQRGNITECPIGHKCSEPGKMQPETCHPGFISQNKSATQCDLCPYGTFCYFSGMSLPIKCKPGYTCQLSGSPFPNQLCPAGSFCTIASVTNVTNSTIQQKSTPVLCFQSTYCLAGAYTPFNDSSNPQAAQICIAGTFCEAGSNSPEGKGKCQAGFYCPMNTFSMIPTEPGYFAQGTGNVDQEKCRPGSYQDLMQQETCKDCSLGSYCPDQGMSKPTLCNQGQYAQLTGLTQCQNCPLGSWSDAVGLIFQKDCKACQPGYICANTGLTKMQSAQACQEGYYCWYGTTTTIMLSNFIESGYYGSQNVTDISRYFLCKPGKYCPIGTASSKVEQLQCIQGYFCPLGTSATLSTEGGKYEPGNFQRDKSILIREIQNLIVQTQLLVKQHEDLWRANDYNGTNGAYTKLNNTLYNYRKYISEKEQNPSYYVAEMPDLTPAEKLLYYQLDWNNTVYNLNKTMIHERSYYLNNTLLVDKKCDKDYLLPSELIEEYFQKGRNLKCPRGTSSDRNSYCIGQCGIQSGGQTAISILTPVISVQSVQSIYPEDPDFNLNIGDNSMNQTYEVPERNYSVNGPGFFDKSFNVTLSPLGMAKIFFDFRNLPPLLLYNKFFQIKLFYTQVETGKPQQLTLPYYFDIANDGVTNKQDIMAIRVFNLQQTNVTFFIQIELYHGLFIPYLEILSKCITIQMSQAQRQQRGTNYTHGIVLSSQQYYSTTLPYNQINYNQDPLLWLDFISTGPGINMTSKNLVKDVFDATYWQSKQIDAIVFPWLPFFSNCDGFDTRIIFYDLFEYFNNTNQSYCNLPKYDDIRVVNPIPTEGLNPVADLCNLNIQCRYDEDLSQLNSATTRWFEIAQTTQLFYITEGPVPIDNFWKKDITNSQTFYQDLINDGSDELIAVEIIPGGGQGLPRTVQVDILYYQYSKDVKKIQSMAVYLLNYDGIDRSNMTRTQIPIEYNLTINYQALNYLMLVDTFQFTVPIYVFLFCIVSLVVFLGIFIVWFITLYIVRSSNPPALRFWQIINVTASSPLYGGVLAAVPVGIAIGGIKYFQQSTFFQDQQSNWSNIDNPITPLEVMINQRGRVGTMFVMCGLVFLYFGSVGMIHKPSESEEREILDLKRKARNIEKLEMSIDVEDEVLFDDDEFDKDEVVNIRMALDWKRRHFYITCLSVSMLLMVKMEYSYTQFMQNNIQYFLMGYMFMDIINEQILVRVILEEALLVAPILTTFTVTEFIMTMGANDLKQFIYSYFMEQSLNLVNRLYIAPFVERMEAWTQIAVITLSKKFLVFRKIFKNILVKQLSTQMQLMSLNEFTAKKRLRLDEDPDYKPYQLEFQQEKGEGMEALLGSTMGYGAQTQSMFMVPIVMIIITEFSNETKIPQNYQIRQADMWIFFAFTVVVILPQLCGDVFTLHGLELTHGYKTYDYFTYCNYKIAIRTKRWINSNTLDRSVKHDFRSLDGFCFGSQFYFLGTICSWGILFLFFGFTIMLRAQFNPFADLPLKYFVFGIPLVAVVIKYVLSYVSELIGIWKITGNDRITIDIGKANRLDFANNMKRLVQNVQTNPFRQKFVMVNREWLVSNLALILGGKSYPGTAGSEFTYLSSVYQTAVNAEAINQRLLKKQSKLRRNQQMLPFNQRGEFDLRVDVSEDSVSDVPVRDWSLPQNLSKVHCYKIARMWLDFSRQQLRLKFMVADIVGAQIRRKCQLCESKFRLQVIQKIDFNAIAAKFREQCQGLQFTKARWRQFYKRRQIFVTLCMECAYIQVLRAAQLRGKDPDLHKLMVSNALKQVGQSDAMVAKKLKQKAVRMIAYRWLWIARGSLLHVEDAEELMKREQKKRLIEMDVSSRFIQSSESDKTEKEESTMGLF